MTDRISRLEVDHPDWKVAGYEGHGFVARNRWRPSIVIEADTLDALAALLGRVDAS